MRHVSFIAIILMAFISFSVSAQNEGQADSLPIQNDNITDTTDSLLVISYLQFSKQYLVINTDSSLYWANRVISFGFAKHNWNYIKKGLQANNEAEAFLLRKGNNKIADLTKELKHQQQVKFILIVAGSIIFLAGLIVLILFLRRNKISKIFEAEKNAYEERLDNVENKLKEIQQKNTDLKQVKADLQLSYEDLQRMNNVKDRLIPMIAHDIRSPLASLQNTLSLTRENIINPEEFHKLSSLLEADVFNLRGMLDNMLMWSREQLFEIKINKVNFDLSETCRDVIAMYRNNLMAKNITLRNYLPDHLEVCTDKEIITAVFRNFFSNAVKFTQPGKNIYISQIYFNGKAFLSIKDEGKGILPEVLQKLNNKDHITTRGTANEKGTGLGLLFCREMLDKLEEVFDITSYLNKGTSVTFSVTLTS